MNKMKRLLRLTADRVGLKSDEYLQDQNDKWKDDFDNVKVAKRVQKKGIDEKRQIILRKYN